MVGEDSGASSATLERAGLQHALDILDGGNADVLLSYDADRFVRSVAHRRRRFPAQDNASGAAAVGGQDRCCGESQLAPSLTR
ncbi:MAG: recombinase family protein [Propionibacteriaceae bacterium]